MVVDPALSTINGHYEPEPAECRVLDSRHVIGNSNTNCLQSLHHQSPLHKLTVAGMSECSWSSCREGCTGQPWECHQVYVEFRTTPPVSSSSPSLVTRTAALKISVKGCGYPPTVNCSVWIRDFGQKNTTFPCYYSQ